jgi:outer membrane protein assembly factor BamB
VQGNPSRTGATDLSGPTGELQALWSFQAPGGLISPVESGGFVYAFGSSGVLYALDAESGEQRWAFNTGSGASNPEAYGMPSIAEGLVCVLAHDGTLYALTAETGEVSWSVDLGTAPLSATSPTIVDGSLYVIDGSGSAVALDLLSGAEKWRAPIATGIHDSILTAGQNGLLYFGSGTGELSTIESQTGKIAWTVTLSDTLLRTPAVDGDTVYVADYDGRLFARDAATGAERWTYEPELNGFGSAPAVSRGVVVLPIEGSGLVALDAGTGDVLWTTPIAPTTSPIIAGGVVYATDTSSEVVALDLETGAEVGRGSIPTLLDFNPPGFAEGRLLVGSSSGIVAEYVTGPVETTTHVAAPPDPVATPAP